MLSISTIGAIIQLREKYTNDVRYRKNTCLPIHQQHQNQSYKHARKFVTWRSIFENEMKM